MFTGHFSAPDGNWTTHGYANSRTAKSRTSQLVDVVASYYVLLGNNKRSMTYVLLF